MSVPGTPERSPWIGAAAPSGLRVVEAVTHDLRMAEVAVRWEVFVAEQHVPPVLEVDGRDFRDDVVHLLALDADGAAVGTARVIPDGKGRYHLGRLAVRGPRRGGGVGVALVEAVHEVVAARTPEGARAVVVLDSQVQAVGFYARLGYAPTTGEVFLDAGIPHQEMAREVAGEARRARPTRGDDPHSIAGPPTGPVGGRPR